MSRPQVGLNIIYHSLEPNLDLPFTAFINPRYDIVVSVGGRFLLPWQLADQLAKILEFTPQE
jgi:hypothetical protein